MTPFLSLIVAATLLVTEGTAQRTNAVCDEDFAWMSNSLKQSPCVMASYLQGVCQPDFVLPAVTRDSGYFGPGSLVESNPCWCSSVTYSLAQACQVCQLAKLPLLEWGWWSSNCSGLDTAMRIFPMELPLRTAIPAWAYEQTYEFNGTFNPDRALHFKAIDNTEVSRTSPFVPTTVPEVDCGFIETANWTGAIVGIVIGSLLSLAVILALVWWFLRRKRLARQEAAKTQHQAVFSIEQNSMADSDVDSIVKIGPDKAI